MTGGIFAYLALKPYREGEKCFPDPGLGSFYSNWTSAVYRWTGVKRFSKDSEDSEG